MITREKLDELDGIIRDLRMVMDFKENVDQDNDFVLLPLSDGSKISTVLGDDKKTEVDNKIKDLDSLLKKKLSELK